MSQTEPDSTRTRPPCVLVVDDDEAVRSVAAKVLRRRGYRVLEASGGDEAIRLLDDPGDAAVDLLLTDVIMPGMNGRELSERLSEGHPDLKVLFMSAYTEDEVILRGVRVAQVDFLAKPFTLQSLGDAVARVLADD